MTERQIALHRLADLSKGERDTLLKRTESDLSDVIERVKPIIEAVKETGDEALVEFGRKFDRADLHLGNLKASEKEFDEAEAAMDAEVVEAINFAAANIRKFHEEQMPEEMWMIEMAPGAWAGDRHKPIDSVACYVPRGKGAFPSVFMMTAIPAIVAGVRDVAVVTPPAEDGNVDAATLVAAKAVGIKNIYKCGGAQAVAAAAYGTQTVPKCDKIVGPGSPWVVAAKRVLSDIIDPGTPAGPSECVILGDETTNPRVAALDLLIESEHGPDSSAFFVTHDEAVANAVCQHTPEYWNKMVEQRKDFASTVLSGNNGGVVLAPSEEEAIAFVNDYAAEHLQLLTKDPMDTLSKIVHAGEILLGHHTPVSLGNFVLGVNAVLPTSMAARTHSPLGVHDFLRRQSVGMVSERAYPALAKQAHRLATYEGFDGHARAVSPERLEALKNT